MIQSKRLLIDGLGLVDGHFSGVGQYILGILQGFDRLIDTYTSSGIEPPEIIVVIPYDKVGRFKEFGFKNIRYRRLPIPFRYLASLWHRRWLPPIDIFCGIGTYLFPRFVDMPLLLSKNGGLIIFDLSYELHRQYSDEGNALFLSKRVRESLKRTRNVITISENAKREIADFYDIKPALISVATPAVNQGTLYRRSPKEIEEIKIKYGITKKNYILALSNLEPRKNLKALVRSYCSLPKDLQDKFSLVLVGVSGWKSDALFDEIRTKVAEGHDIIRPSHYVTDVDKPAIISGSSLLVYPSHYEGFGMPPLEALACGVPVITSDNSSLPEVVEGVGKMVSVSGSTDQLTQSLKETLENIKDITRETLKAGPRRASEFSWEKSAQIILDSIQRNVW